MLRQKSTDLVQGILCCGELVQQLVVVRLQLIQHLGAIFHPLLFSPKSDIQKNLFGLLLSLPLLEDKSKQVFRTDLNLIAAL